MRLTKAQIASQLEDTRLIIRAVRCGAMAFDDSTGECRYSGMRYSTTNTEWLLNHFGRTNVVYLCSVLEKQKGLRWPDD